MTKHKKRLILSSLTEADIKSKLKSYINAITFEEGYPRLSHDAISVSDGEEIARCFSKKIIDNKVIYNLILEILTDALYSAKTPKIEDSITKISEVEFLNQDALIKSVLDILKRLPIKYEFIFPLNLNQSHLIKDSIDLTDNIKLLLIGDKELTKYKPQKLMTDQLFHPGELELKKDSIAIFIKSVGFVSKFGIPKLLTEDPLYLFKIIIGFYLGMGVIDIDDKFYSRSTGTAAGYSYKTFDKNDFVTTLRESSDDASFISSLLLSQNSFNTSLPQVGDVIWPNNFEISNTYLKKILNVQKFKKGKPEGFNPTAIKKLMSNKAKIADHGFQLRNGAYWLYEAFKSSQPHSQIIYLVTAFDSLCGNADEKSDKAEMIAYSIASSTSELEMIKEYIINLYDLRNKIIHGKEALYKLLDHNQKVEVEKHPIVIKLTCRAYLKRYLQKMGFLYSRSIADT